MLFQLQHYDLKITYTSGKEMHVADTLSCAVVTDCKDDVKEDLFEKEWLTPWRPQLNSTQTLLKHRRILQLLTEYYNRYCTELHHCG